MATKETVDRETLWRASVLLRDASSDLRVAAMQTKPALKSALVIEAELKMDAARKLIPEEAF